MGVPFVITFFFKFRCCILLTIEILHDTLMCEEKVFSDWSAFQYISMLTGIPKYDRIETIKTIYLYRMGVSVFVVFFLF